MKTKHTPGEWNAKEGQIYSLETGKTIALIPYFDNTSEEQEANQKLFAAAPELFQMVNNLKNCIGRLCHDRVSQEDRDKEAQWIGEAHELLHQINPNYYKNANQ